jgi:hypothetical protein
MDHTHITTSQSPGLLPASGADLRRRSRRRTGKAGFAGFAAAALFALGVAPAHADPRNHDTVTAACDHLGSVTFALFSSGHWSAGLVLTGNGVLVPIETHSVGTFTPIDGDPIPFDEYQVKPTPQNGRTDHCTIDTTFSGPDGTAVVHIDAVLAYTPKV